MAKNLARLIREQGYPSLELFAHENGFGKSWIAKLCRGAVDVKLSNLARVARSLNVTLDELCPVKGKKK